MKAITIAAAAVLLGSVSADGWEGWSASADSEDSKTYADDSKTYEDDSKTYNFGESDAKTKDSDSDSATWSTWSSTKADPTTTWSDWSSTKADPTTTWSDWSSTKVDPTSTWSAWSSVKSDDPSSTWSAWSSADPASWSSWKSSADPTTSWSQWTSAKADPSSTWSAWESSKSADPSSSSWSAWKGSDSDKSSETTTWSAWDPKKTVTSTSTNWVTVTVYSNDDGQSWSAWSDGSDYVDSKTVVVSSTLTKTASSSDASWTAWAAVDGKGAAAVDNGCQMQVSYSYGPPVWYPTPVLAASSDPSSWGTWDPAKETSSSSSWSAWESASSTSVKDDSTTSWSAWSTSSADPTSTSTWAAWDGSDSGKAGNKVVASSSWSAWDGSAAKTSAASSSASTWGNWVQSEKGISANGDKFGMTYSPYTSDGKCKDAGTVSGDIKKIAEKGFTSVRVYSTDCSTLENVGAAAKECGIKVILGVFISETGISGAQPQVDAISKWAQWDLVELIVVGNEAVFQGRCSAEELAGFIASSKSAFQGAGYKGAVSTTDELSVWKGQGSAWCDSVDVVTANLYAFFNAEVEASGAGKFIQAQIDELSQVCPGKEVYVMESGWPKEGECNGKACPSPENQATAIKGIQEASGAKVVFFSFEDEQWKQPGQFGVEQHWGCGDVF